MRASTRPTGMNDDFAISRRLLLSRIGAGIPATALVAMLGDKSRAAWLPRPHFAPRAKHVIHLFMNGGPSQVDTFDPKPALAKHRGDRPQAIRGRKTERPTGGLLPSPFQFRRYGESGLEVSELFSRTARFADDLCVIRSMHTDVPNHEPSLLMMNCGHPQPVRPSYGSWLTYGLGSENANLPGFVVVCPGRPVVGDPLWSSRFLPGSHAGVHVHPRELATGRAIAHLQNPQLSSAEQRRQLDLLQRLNRRHQDRRPGDARLEARIAALETAFRMQTSAAEAFDLRREPQRVIEDYGPGDFAHGCLAARRLVERGVRVVQVYFAAGQPWDHHQDVRRMRIVAPQADRAIAALLGDLKRQGLLGETLVLWGGEFGRTPTVENTRGRDHNSYGFSIWMAGGGVRGGHVHGATDDFGFAATEDKVHVHDLHATMLHLMGLDHTRLNFAYGGREHRLTDVKGRVVEDVL